MRKYYLISIIFIVFQQFSAGQESSSFLRGIVALQNNKESIAVQEFNLAIKNNEYSEKSTFYRGVASFILKDFNSALIDFEQCIEYGNSLVWLWLAKTHSLNGNAGKAISCLEQYLEENPATDILNITKDTAFKPLHKTVEWESFVSKDLTFVQNAIQESNFYLKRGDFSESHNVIQKTQAQYADNAALYSQIAKIYFAEENLTLAIYEMRKAVNLEPENTDYLKMLAAYYSGFGDYKKSAEYYDLALKQEPENLTLYYNKSLNLLKSNNAEDAKETISNYLIYFKEDTAAIYLLASINLALDDYIAALKSLNLLIRNYKPRAEWYYLRGQTYFMTSTYKYAAEDLSMSLDLNPASAETNLLLGLTLKKLGKTNSACYYFKKAYKLGEMKAFEQIQDHCPD